MRTPEELLKEIVDAIENTREGGRFYPELVFHNLPEGWLRDAKESLSTTTLKSGVVQGGEVVK